MSMFGRFLCRRGLHWWEFVGWAEYGRGRIERCARILSNGDRCPVCRTLPIETRLLEQVLKTDLAKIEARPRPPGESDPDTKRFMKELDQLIRSEDQIHTRNIQSLADSKCPDCHRWRSPNSAYCIKCGSGRTKPERPGPA